MEKFSKVSESQITRSIVEKFMQDFLSAINSDVIVVGGGPSGLVAARELALAKKNVTVIESNNYLGGGFWIGGYLMNGLTVRVPGDAVLSELGIPYEEVAPGLCITTGPHACSKLIAAACDAGVRIINMTKVDDVVIREDGRVVGVVINWTPVGALPRAITCVDPVSLESKLVIDATGHDAIVASALAKRGYLKLKGFDAMWVEKSEDLVVEKSGEVHPGLLVCGMATAEVFGIPRMGPTFGGMLLSGKKVAQVALKILDKELVPVR